MFLLSSSNLDRISLPAIFAIVGVVVLVGKCTLVMYCCHIRSRNIQVYSRVHVSLREADELQHQQAPTRVPPVYNPRAFQDDTNNPVMEPPSVYTPNFRINPIQSVENNRNTNNVDGVEQGHRMAPQSAFPLQNLPSQSTNSAQTYQTQGVAGNVEQTNAVPQVSFTVPPSINPASFSANTSQNAT